MSIISSFIDQITGAIRPNEPEGPKEGEIVPLISGGDLVIDGQQTEAGFSMGDEDARKIYGMISGVVSETDTVHRWSIRRVRKGREYYNGREDVVLDPTTSSYLPITAINSAAVGLDKEDEDLDPIYSWNIYQSTGSYIISVLTGSPPTTKFYPKNADKGADVQTARAANEIVELFHRTNNIETLIQEEARLLFTDGMFAAYIRHTIDGQRFGYREKPIYQKRQVMTVPPRITCGTCGLTTNFGEDTTVAPNPPQMCPQCGAPLDPMMALPPEFSTTDDLVGTETIANGGEIVDVYGQLEVRVDPSARHLRNAQWLTLRTEEDVSMVRAMYPALADKINPYGVNSNDSVATEERLARMSLTSGGWQGPFLTGGFDEFKSRVTLSRTWIRPSLFYRLVGEDELRDRLISQFPKGCLMVYAGDTFCEARNESLDDYWVTCHAMPGDGMIRPSLGDILLDPQDALNDLMDAELSVARHSIPFWLMDKEMISNTDFSKSRSKGGAIYDVERKGGEPLGASVFEAATSGSNPTAVGLREGIFGPITQWLTGTLPGMTGQSDPNLKTAKAYAQAKEMAMGKLGPCWRNMKEAHVQMCVLAVKHYIANREVDVAVPFQTPIGFKNKFIKKSDLTGEIVAYPESDEAAPISSSDKREQINQLFGNPQTASIPLSPANIDYTKSVMSWGSLELPGESDRRKQLYEIGKLLEGEPQLMFPPPPPPEGPVMMTPQGPMMMTQMGPQPLPPPPPPVPVPSVPVYLKTDNHPIEAAVCQQWMNSEEGLATLVENPAAYENVRLHCELHLDAAKVAPSLPPNAGLQFMPGMPPPPGGVSQPVPGGPPPAMPQAPPGPPPGIGAGPMNPSPQGPNMAESGMGPGAPPAANFGPTRPNGPIGELER